ncbi:MAG: type II toxin-antitoxin system VapC family toxin [Deltaproteobacteria bacterium]|nr:type II toxin-antitoxin system VapC family toxin [Deltaproteobacteria bacterium]
MKRILIDTNVYVAFKRNDSLVLDVLQHAEYIGLSMVVFGELLCGFKGGKRELKNKEELDQFLDSPRVNLLQLDEETAEYYSKIYWDLKNKGKPIPSNDIWIAANAMKQGLAVFTFDNHFSYIDGLMLHDMSLRRKQL